MTPPQPRSPPLTRSGLATLAILLAFEILALALYSPALRGEFVSDDLRFITENGRNLDAVSAPWRFLTEPDLAATPPDADIYRPLRTFSFAVDRALFGASRTAFHVHGVLLHGLVAFLLLVLVRGIPSLARAAPFAALLFLVHPLASEAVAWISSRADLQAGVIVLLALLAARRFEAVRGIRSGLLVAALAFLAGLAKETAVVLPALFLIEHRLRRGRLERSAIAALVLLLAGSLAWLAVYLQVRDRGVTGQVGFYGGSFASHLPYAILGIGRQLQLLVWPTHFNFNYDAFLFHPPDPIAVAAALATIAVFVGIAIGFRRRCPGIGLGLAFHAIALLPAANLVLPLRAVLAERFAYVPLFGAAIAAAAALELIRSRLERAPLAERARSTAPPVLAVRVVLLCLLVGLGAKTMLRASEWSSAKRLYESALAAWPDSYSAALGLGDVATKEGRHDEAIAAFERAIDLARGDPALRIKAAFALGRAWLLKRDGPRAISVLSPTVGALDRDPSVAKHLPDVDAGARQALGTACWLALRLDEAARIFDDLIARFGATAERCDARAEIERARAGDPTIMLDNYQRAIELDPDYAKARIHRAQLLHQLGRLEAEAMRDLREVLNRDPGNLEARALLERFRAEAAAGK